MSGKPIIEHCWSCNCAMEIDPSCRAEPVCDFRAAGIAPQDQAAMMHAMAQQQQQQHALQQQGEALAGDAEFERERKEKRCALQLSGLIQINLECAQLQRGCMRKAEYSIHRTFCSQAHDSKRRILDLIRSSV